MKTEFASLVVLAATALASPGSRLPPKPQGLKPRSHPEPEKVGSGTFDQLLDHDDPSKGTFEQRYWYNRDSYGGPGSPIFILNAGETDASQGLGWMNNDTLPGMYAQHFNGAVILFEHRYFGQSIPYDELTAETLQQLTLSNSIKDQSYFAKNVKLDFDSAGPDESPWILMGGSYPGALAAWTSRLDPGVFAAYHASSAVVEAIGDFWTYYVATESALPAGCAADVKRVIGHMDDVLEKGSRDDVDRLKKAFGVESLDHAGDVAALVAQPLAQWQSDPLAVYNFCDYLESWGQSKAAAATADITAYNNNNNKTENVPPRTASPRDNAGTGLESALAAYASYVKQAFQASCGDGSCDTYAPRTEGLFNRPHNLGADRGWMWLVCNEPFLWWQVGPPSSDGNNIVSSQLRPEYYQRQCDLFFPETGGFKPGISRGAEVEDVNNLTGGWDADFEKVLFCNGEFDPWIAATVSAPSHPGGARVTSEQTPVFVMKNGNHVPDFEIRDVDEGDFWDVVDGEFEVMGRWLKDWKPLGSFVG